jgi:hypothetical protein
VNLGFVQAETLSFGMSLNVGPHLLCSSLFWPWLILKIYTTSSVMAGGKVIKACQPHENFMRDYATRGLGPRCRQSSWHVESSSSSLYKVFMCLLLDSHLIQPDPTGSTANTIRHAHCIHLCYSFFFSFRV